MRDYIRAHGLSIGPQQLELLVPAFDEAWAEVSSRGGFLLAGNDLQALKDRVAKVVVELVTTGGLTEAHQIAVAAARSILS